MVGEGVKFMSDKAVVMGEEMLISKLRSAGEG